MRWALLWAIPPYLAIYIGIFVMPGAWVALLGYHLALIIPLLPRLRMLPTLFRASVSPRLMLLMVYMGLMGGVGLWTVWPFTGVSLHYREQLSILNMMTDDFVWGAFIVYFGLVNPWFEEAFWRDLLNSPARGPALVDFLFAGFHLIILARFVSLFWMFVALLIIAGAGWSWRTLNRLTGSMLPATIFHILADLSIVWVVYQKSLL